MWSASSGKSIPFATCLIPYAGIDFLQHSAEDRLVGLKDAAKNHIHGDMPRKKRDAMQEFRSGSSRVLILTDFWGRGLDVWQVSVVAMTCPTIASCTSTALAAVENNDIRILRDIEQFYSTQIDEMPMNVADLI